MKILILISVMISFSASGFTQHLSGTFENTNMNLSSYPGWMDLTMTEYEGVTLGIAAKEAYGGIVTIDANNRVISEGAGIFAGTEEHKWPLAKVLLLTYDGKSYKDMGLSCSCTNVYYEGIVLKEQIEISNTDGTVAKYYVAKPILGKFDSFSDNAENSNFISDSGKDFSDGYFVSEKYGRLKVLIVSSIRNVQLIFVVDKDTAQNATPNKIENFFSFFLTPTGLIVCFIFIIFILLGIILIYYRKKRNKK